MDSQFEYKRMKEGELTQFTAPTPDAVVIVREEPVYDESTNRHRIAAMTLSILSMFCSSWLCALPAVILACVPHCSNNKLARSRLVRPLYIASIVLAVLSIATTVTILICFSVHYKEYQQYFDKMYAKATMTCFYDDNNDLIC